MLVALVAVAILLFLILWAMLHKDSLTFSLLVFFRMLSGVTTGFLASLLLINFKYLLSDRNTLTVLGVPFLAIAVIHTVAWFASGGYRNWCEEMRSIKDRFINHPLFYSSFIMTFLGVVVVSCQK